MTTAWHGPQFPTSDEAAALAKERHVTYVDAFERQIKELFFIETPSYIGTPKTQAYVSDDFVSFAKRCADTFVYVYYPWNHHLVKSVTAEAYFKLKTNRNQDLITASEQARLYQSRVVVCGLSVGSNIAFALTQAGISRRIILADFDELDTTNLNRIFAGVHQIGLNKSIVTAQRVYEDNPFADVRLLDQGIDAVKLRSLLEEKAVDIIVDEVDDIRFKIGARKLAMEFQIPVLMVTDNGDGIVLHVERYDLGHDRIFGKEASHFATLPDHLSREQVGKIIMEDIVGGAQRVDPAMLASVRRVLDRELVSWSQLGSAALLAGVAATYMIKQILLDRSNERDIRAYLSPRAVLWESHQ